MEHRIKVIRFFNTSKLVFYFPPKYFSWWWCTLSNIYDLFGTIWNRKNAGLYICFDGSKWVMNIFLFIWAMMMLLECWQMCESNSWSSPSNLHVERKYIRTTKVITFFWDLLGFIWNLKCHWTGNVESLNSNNKHHSSSFGRRIAPSENISKSKT